MKIQDFTVIFRSEPEGGFTAIVPSLPGCVTYGKSLPEAKIMITDAIEGYIASLIKHNEPVPSDDKTFISTIHVHNAVNSTTYA